MTYAIHPACAAWPRPSDAKIREIAASIKAIGLQNPIWLTRKGEVLDGKTRLECCEIAGVEPHFVTYEGDDVMAFTLAQNDYRRKTLPKGELALVLAALSKLPRGGDPRSNVRARTLDEDKTMDELAKAGEMSRQNIVAGKAILEEGEPNVIDMVRKGEVGVRNAALYVKYTSRADQRQATAKTVKTQGAARRTPNKPPAPAADNPQNITSANYIRRPPSVSRPALPAEELARIRAMPEKMVSIHVLIEELHPLFKEVQSQSQCHQARVSQTSLAITAGRGLKLLETWASDDPTVRRMRGHVVPFKQPAIRKKG